MTRSARTRGAAAAATATAAAAMVLAACGSGAPQGVTSITTIPVGPSTTSVRATVDTKAQNALLTAAAVLNRYYQDAGYGFTGISVPAFMGLNPAGVSAVTAAAPSTGPTVVSIDGADQQAEVVAFVPQTRTCWGILMTADVNGTNNVYVETPASEQSTCRASGYATHPPHGTIISTVGFSNLG